MALPDTLSQPAVDRRHGNAMLMMVVSSVLISFGGLIIRSLDDSSPWPVNFHRSIGLLGAVTVILLLRYRGQALAVLRSIGRIGIVGGVLILGESLTPRIILGGVLAITGIAIINLVPTRAS